MQHFHNASVDPNRFYQTTFCSTWSQCSQILIHHAQQIDKCDQLTLTLEEEHVTTSKLILLMQRLDPTFVLITTMAYVNDISLLQIVKERRQNIWIR